MRWSINVFSDFLDHMYYFEGKDYSKDPSAADEKTFELLLEKQLADLEDAGKEGRALRNKAGVTYLKGYTTIKTFGVMCIDECISFTIIYYYYYYCIFSK